MNNQRTFDQLLTGSPISKMHASILSALTKDCLISEAEAEQTAKRLIIQMLENTPAYTLSLRAEE